jgi:hypothetical protein
MPRWATVVGVIGGLLLSAAAVAEELIENADSGNLGGVSVSLLFIGTPLFLFAVARVQLRQEARVRWLSRIACLVLVLALLLAGEFARGYGVYGLPFAVLAAILFGLSALRAHVFSAVPPWLLVVVPALAIAAFVANSDVLITLYGALYPLPYVWLALEASMGARTSPASLEGVRGSG